MSEPVRIDLDYDWTATISVDDAWWVVRFHPGPRPFGDVVGLVRPLWELLQQRDAQRVVLEMQEVEFLSSSLIGELVRLYKRLSQVDGALRLCGLRPACREAIRVCRLQEVLPSEPTREQAIAMQS